MKKQYYKIVRNGILLISYMALMGFIFHMVLLHFFFSEPDIIQAASSPDGHYIAYVFESNGGATSGFIYHLSIMENGKKLRKGHGNTHISNFPFSVKWIEDDILEVYDTSENYLHKDSIKGIQILYCNASS